MIQPLKPVDYNKLFISNELNMRNKDQASVLIQKINEMIESLNGLREIVIELDHWAQSTQSNFDKANNVLNAIDIPEGDAKDDTGNI